MTRESLTRALVTVARTLAWAFLAALVAAGAAGLVALLDHPPGTAARAELTWAADAIATAELDRVQGQLEALEGEVVELGRQARGALASLAGQDVDTVQATVDDGAVLVSRIRDTSRAIRAELLALPGVTGPTARLQTSDAVRSRHAAMLDALQLTEELDDAWVRLTTGSLAAARLSNFLADHDRTMGDAILEGRDGRYDEAIAKIDEAAGILGQADRMRAELANTVDVTTLEEWIRRNRRYEDALRTLYQAVDASGGRQNRAVQAALEEERAARAELPPDTRGLIVIMGEIGRGGLNGAVIAIEEARGELSNALSKLAASAAGS